MPSIFVLECRKRRNYFNLFFTICYLKTEPQKYFVNMTEILLISMIFGLFAQGLESASNSLSMQKLKSESVLFWDIFTGFSNNITSFKTMLIFLVSGLAKLSFCMIVPCRTMSSYLHHKSLWEIFRQFTVAVNIEYILDYRQT